MSARDARDVERDSALPQEPRLPYRMGEQDGQQDRPDRGAAFLVTSPTGGQKGQKLAQLGALDPLALLTLAEVAGHGSAKYSRANFLKGYEWSLSFDAMQRHALLMWGGEDFDPESTFPHAAHVAWHGLCLTSFLLRGIGTDDRFRP